MSTPTSDLLRMHLEAEAELTRKMLAAIPEDRLDYKPHPKSMSLAELGGHIAETPSWVVSMAEDGMDMTEMMKEWKPFVPESRAEMLERHEQSVQLALEVVTGKDEAFMGATWTMRAGDQVLMQCPRAEVMRQMLVHHLCHHRGQLSVYLRLLDAPVPGTYGPSADEAPTF